MPDVLQIKRGLKEQLPTEALEGELLLCTDTKELYVGANGKVERIAMQSDVLITSNIPMQADVGGLKAGTTFNNAPINEVLMQLLYPYTAPIMSLSTNQPNLNEHGVSLSNTTCTIKIIKTMHEITSVTLFRNGKKLQVWNEIPISDYDTPITLLYFDGVPLENDVTYYVEITDTEKSHHISSAIKFEQPVYIGCCTNVVPTIQEINQSLKSLKSKSDFIFNFTTDSTRMMILYPKAWGELNSIKNAFDVELKNSFKHTIITHETVAGVQEYHVYVSSLTTLIDHRMRFAF